MKITQESLKMLIGYVLAYKKHSNNLELQESVPCMKHTLRSNDSDIILQKYQDYFAEAIKEEDGFLESLSDLHDVIGEILSNE